MKHEKLYPFAVAYGFPGDSGVTFLFPDKEVFVEGENDVVLSLLRYCNGHRSIKKITNIVSSATNYPEQEISKLINMLFKCGVLVDAYKYYETFHEVSANPMPFLMSHTDKDVSRMLEAGNDLVQQSSDLEKTPFEQLLENRKSARSFSGDAIDKQTLMRLSWAVYGKLDRSTRMSVGTVPSGGALYPLQLFAIVTKASPSIKMGIYNFSAGKLTNLNDLSKNALDDVFIGNPHYINDSAVVLIIACDFHRITQKYSNRGYRYALLEAGHAAQNAYLWCAENKYGVVEIGGFDDRKLTDLLKLSYPSQAPIIALVIGRE